MGDGKKKALNVYSVGCSEGQDNDWIKIGSAFPHLDGKGFDIVLEAYPLHARLFLRTQVETKKPDGERPSLAQQVEAFERAVIEQCLVESGGKIGAVLDRLGIPRRTLNEKMARLGIKRQRLICEMKPTDADKTFKNGKNMPIR